MRTALEKKEPEGLQGVGKLEKIQNLKASKPVVGPRHRT